MKCSVGAEITLRDDELHISTRRIPYAATAGGRRARTLQRYAITFWLLSASPSINRSTLERSRTVAQRLSVLHGINAPEFFQQSGVQFTRVDALRDEGLYQ